MFDVGLIKVFIFIINDRIFCLWKKENIIVYGCMIEFFLENDVGLYEINVVMDY